MRVNKALLRKVAKYILEEPRRYNQGTFGNSVSKRTSPCGTQACIAGWAAFLGFGFEPADKDPDEVCDEGRKALGLTRHESDILFIGEPGDEWNLNDWPEPYATDYQKARTKQAKAEVAARYLRRIARTGKVR